MTADYFSRYLMQAFTRYRQLLIPFKNPFYNLRKYRDITITDAFYH